MATVDPTLEEEARSKLRAWHDAAPVARIDPTKISIHAARRLEVTQVVVREVYEARELVVRSRSRVPAKGPRFDPWTLPIEIPPDAPVGAEVRRAVEGIVVDCGDCDYGSVRCSRCSGDGKHRRTPESKERDTVPCSRCRASGRVRCKTCRGGGCVEGTGEVVARIVEGVWARGAPRPGGPLGIEARFGAACATGEILATNTAPTLAEAVELPVTGGYRDQTHLDAAALELLDELRQDTPELRPGRSVTVEVRRVPVLALEVTPPRTLLDHLDLRVFDGELWIWDEPPRVAPEMMLTVSRASMVKLAAIVGSIAAGLGLVAWLLYG